MSVEQSEIKEFADFDTLHATSGPGNNALSMMNLL